MLKTVKGLNDIMLRLFGNPLLIACLAVTCVILAAAFLSMIQTVPEYRSMIQMVLDYCGGELLRLLQRFMQI